MYLHFAVPPSKHQSNLSTLCHVSKDNRKTQAQFECVSCDYKNHADVVGAINVLERGHRLLARGEMVHLGRSKKQEPAEVSQLVLTERRRNPLHLWRGGCQLQQCSLLDSQVISAHQTPRVPDNQST